MERRLAIAAMTLAVYVVPIGFFVDAANDEFRDSNLGAIAVADAFIGLIMLACFWQAVSRAVRSGRLAFATGVVIAAVAAAHLAAWWLATRHDAGAAMFIPYLIGGAVATLVVSRIPGRRSEDRAPSDHTAP